MHLPMAGSMSLPLNLRRFLIERFIEQKEQENQAIESQQKKAGRK